MTITDDELSAYLDGEMPPQDLKRIAAAIDADASLRRRIEALAASDRIVARAYSAIDSSPLPASVTALLADEEPETTHAPGRPPFQAGRALPLAAALALAAGVGLGLMLAPPRSAATFAQTIAPKSELYAALESAPSGGAVKLADGGTATLVLSFESPSGYCREFILASADNGMRGIACRDAANWKLAFAAAQAPAGGGYAPATSVVAASFDAAAEALGANASLDPAEEAALLKSGWRRSEP